MLTALGCRHLWDADIWKSEYFRWMVPGHTSALDALSVHAFHAIRLFHAFHAICLVSCFMRYALYYASCDMPYIMLYAICLISYFMRYALYYASCEKSVLCEGLALGHI